MDRKIGGKFSRDEHHLSAFSGRSKCNEEDLRGELQPRLMSLYLLHDLFLAR